MFSLPFFSWTALRPDGHGVPCPYNCFNYAAAIPSRSFCSFDTRFGTFSP
jgi:hypothetical protein